MSPSTTTPALPLLPSIRMRRPSPQLLSWPKPQPTTSLWASPSNAYSRIMAPAFARIASVILAVPCSSAPNVLASIDHKPMVRLSASSKLPSGNGLMPGNTKTQIKETNTYNLGPTNTTGIDLMLAANTPLPSPPLDSMSTTC